MGESCEGLTKTFPFLKKLNNYMFVIMILAFIGIIYFVNVKLVWIDRFSDSIGFYPYMLVFHAFFVLLLWSLFKTMFTDPGKVPLYWGYYLDENENKKKRYCLICLIFKPERCHHCSACNRCVLNMDHHCPWINNCVGFQNRKFFILMLTYVILTDLFGIIPMSICVYDIIEDIHLNMQGEDIQINWFTDFIIMAGDLLGIAAFIVIGNFYKFHLHLVFSNTTTIENLEKKRNMNNKQSGPSQNFDMGKYYNFVQVFGKNKLMWPFPFFTETAQPVGDGVVWPRRYNEEPEQEQLQSTINAQRGAGNNLQSNNNNNQRNQLATNNSQNNNNSNLNNSQLKNRNINNNSSIQNSNHKNNNNTITNNSQYQQPQGQDYQPLGAQNSQFYNNSQTQPQNGFNGSYQQKGGVQYSNQNNNNNGLNSYQQRH